MSRIVLLCFFLLLSQGALALPYTIEISENELQQKVTSMMPIRMKLFLATVVLPDPKVSLIKDTNEIAISSAIEVLVPGVIKASGNTRIQGTLSYDAKAGEFFLKNPTVVEFDVDQLPEKYRLQAKEITQLLVQQILATSPIYRLDDDNLQHRLAKSVLQSVTVKNEKLLVVLDVL